VAAQVKQSDYHSKQWYKYLVLVVIRRFSLKYSQLTVMKSYEECFVECQEQNLFFKVGGSLVGRFAYTREAPFIQPFETIESPWADFIKSDSMETNRKKLFKLAQKYSKSQKQEAKEEKSKEQEKPKEEEKPKEQEKPDQEKSKGKSSDKEKEEEETPKLSRTEYNRLESRWISVAQSAPLTPQQKQTILSLAKTHPEI
jgi:hypothetical protein